MGAKCSSHCCCCKSDVIQPQSQPVTSRVETSIYREQSGMQRFDKISISKRNPLELINGYLNEPLVSLEDALQPFDGKIDQLSHYIKEAKTKCHYPSKHNLTRDESAAIYIYTMKWDHICLYDRLQEAWESKDRTKLEPWFKYFKLFKSGLNKLPHTNTEFWQETSFNESLKQQLSSKSASLFTSMGSCSPSEKELQKNLEKHAGKKVIRVCYKAIGGKLVTGYTANSSGEVILWPGTKLAVTKYGEDPTTGSLIVHLTKKSGE